MPSGFQVAHADVFRICHRARAPIGAAEVRRAKTVGEVAGARVVVAIGSAIVTPWYERYHLLSVHIYGVWLLVELIAAAPAAMTGCEIIEASVFTSSFSSKVVVSESLSMNVG